MLSSRFKKNWIISLTVALYTVVYLRTSNMFYKNLSPIIWKGGINTVKLVFIYGV